MVMTLQEGRRRGDATEAIEIKRNLIRPQVLRSAMTSKPSRSFPTNASFPCGQPYSCFRILNFYWPLHNNGARALTLTADM
jgi:hypothetical protein